MKEYVEERQLNVLVVVDLSASQEFGSGPSRNARVASEIAAILALAAAANNDRVGLLLVTDRVELFVCLCACAPFRSCGLRSARGLAAWGGGGKGRAIRHGPIWP